VKIKNMSFLKRWSDMIGKVFHSFSARVESNDFGDDDYKYLAPLYNKTVMWNVQWRNFTHPEGEGVGCWCGTHMATELMGVTLHEFGENDGFSTSSCDRYMDHTLRMFSDIPPQNRHKVWFSTKMPDVRIKQDKML
jgi:hypothetical protein